MFGYHDNDRCGFDLWSPADEKHRCDMTDPAPDFYNVMHNRSHGWDDNTRPFCARENRAFSPYAKHEQEKEDVIQEIIRQYNCGNYQFTIDLDDDFSESDAAYIQSEVQRRLGRQNLSLIFYKKYNIIFT